MLLVILRPNLFNCRIDHSRDHTLAKVKSNADATQDILHDIPIQRSVVFLRTPSQYNEEYFSIVYPEGLGSPTSKRSGGPHCVHSFSRYRQSDPPWQESHMGHQRR